MDLNFSAHQEDSQENKKKKKPQKQKYIHIYPAKDLYPEHIKKSYQSTTNLF